MTRAQIKYIRSLSLKKFRRETGHFVVEGHKMVEELLDSDFVVEEIYTDQPFSSPRSGMSVVPAKAAELQEVSGMATSPGIMAICRQKTWNFIEPQQLSGMTLLLDSIVDPGNLGTIIRSADWFGIDQVICSIDTVEVYNPKVVQSTMGSVFRIPVVYMDLTTTIGQLKAAGIPVMGADASGTDYRKVQRNSKCGLVIGSESHGISAAVKSQLNQLIGIPGSGNAESLNAAIAAAILCAYFAN
jgi:TrmH family RNA methyltransferase